MGQQVPQSTRNHPQEYTVPEVLLTGKLETNTRSKHDLHTQSRNTALLQNSVLHKGVRLYKCLPLKIKKLDNFKQFRKEVKLMLNNSFYTLEEFLQAKLA
jgi:hypothetical protein